MRVKHKIILLGIAANIAISSGVSAQVNLDNLVTRAERGLSECVIELVKLDTHTLKPGDKPLNPVWLEIQYQEVDKAYGEGQGLAECLTNIDSIVEWLERQ